MIDGVRVNDPTNARGGSFDFSLLSTENIERIEVVRGALPAQWNTNAPAGAVNIVTRRGEGDGEITLEADGGEHGYYRGLVLANGQAGFFDYSMTASTLDEGVQQEGAEFRSNSFAGSWGFEPSDRFEVRGTFRFVDADQEAYREASGGPDLSPVRAVEDRDSRLTVMGLAVHHELAGWWRHSLQWGLFDEDGDLAQPALPPGVGNPFGLPASEFDSDFTRNELSWNHSFSLPGEIGLTTGLKARFERGSNDGWLELAPGVETPSDFSMHRSVYSPYAEIDVEPLPRLRVQFGARYDDATRGEDDEWSPRVGVSYDVSSFDLVLRASYGQGFKLPSFFALSDPTVGNPELKAEESETFDVGFAKYLWDRRASVEFTYYYSEFDDLVDFDPVAFQLVNRSDVTIYGVEAELAVQPIPTLGIRGHLTTARADIKGESGKLRNRPEWRGGLSLRWRPSERLDATMNGIYVGTVHDFSVPTGEVKLDSWVRVDAAVNYEVRSGLEGFVSIENLFDEDYEEFVGFPAPGITARFGVRFTP
jgi:iron complex outermembrane receptor protein/vitamin B12 transporter